MDGHVLTGEYNHSKGLFTLEHVVWTRVHLTRLVCWAWNLFSNSCMILLEHGNLMYILLLLIVEWIQTNLNLFQYEKAAWFTCVHLIMHQSFVFACRNCLWQVSLLLLLFQDASDVKICSWKSKGLKYDYNKWGEYWGIYIIAHAADICCWWCKRITVWSQIMQCRNIVRNDLRFRPTNRTESLRNNPQIQNKYPAHGIYCIL